MLMDDIGVITYRMEVHIYHTVIVETNKELITFVIEKGVNFTVTGFS